MPSIPKLLAQHLGKRSDLGFRDMTLTKFTPGTRTPGAVSAGTNPTSADYACRGFEEQYAASRIDGTIVQVDDRKISILGASIASSAVPAVGDKITSAGVAYRVISVGRDPVGAIYECQCRR